MYFMYICDDVILCAFIAFIGCYTKKEINVEDTSIIIFLI